MSRRPPVEQTGPLRTARALLGLDQVSGVRRRCARTDLRRPAGLCGNGVTAVDETAPGGHPRTPGHHQRG